MTTQPAAAALSTLTPREIDEALAGLYGKVYDAEDALARAWKSVHYAADDKQLGRKAWRMTEMQALRAAEAKMAAATPVRAQEIQRVLDRLATAEVALTAAERVTEPFEAEYARRPWTRFFVVSDGHIHSSMSCSTCNKGGQRTRFGWNPALSGKTMADAIAYFEKDGKGRSEVLCSVCFTDAPRDWMVAQADPNTCPGSGTRDYDEKTARRGYASGNSATCNHCGQYKAVSNRGFGNLVKHAKKA